MNTKNKFIRCSGLLLASLITLPSHAVPITVGSDVTNLFVDGSANATGSFNINAAAAGLGFTAPLSVNSATLTFSFADNPNEYGSSSAPAYSSSTLIQTTDAPCNTLNCPHRFYWLDRYDTYGTDPAETATVQVGAQSASAGTIGQRVFSMGSPFALGGESCGTFGCAFSPVTRSHCSSGFGGTFCDGPWPVYEQIGHTFYYYEGVFSLSLTLDSASLFDLATDGSLNFTIGASLGNFNFLSASLFADISQGVGPGPTDPTDPTDPIDPQQPVGVPEPSSLAMMVMGLFFVARIQSRSRKSKWQGLALPTAA